MFWLVVLGFICVIAIIAAGWWLRSQMYTLTQEVLRQTRDDLARFSSQTLHTEQMARTHELEITRKSVETQVQGLEAQLKRYEELIRVFESDRDQKYGKLQNQLERVVTGADQLQQTTANLVSVLSNSRIRGQWGQQMAEDILRACGLKERIHYLKEQELSSGSGRPDYTFLLPEDHQLFMDVKFPLENYLKFTQSAPQDQPRFRDLFVKDVKEHLREMTRRDYLAQSDRSLDYLVIFIPNEQVYGLVHEWIPGLLDDCLNKRILLCGPSTLYAVLRIIWQSWQHYHYSRTIENIIQTINAFLADYGKFKERFLELGQRLERVTEKYREITSSSYRRLDDKIQQIEAYRTGHISESLPEAGPISDSLSAVESQT